MFVIWTFRVLVDVHKAEVVQDSMGTNISVAAFAPLWHVSLKVAVVLHNSPLQNLAPLTGCHCQYSAVEFYCAAVAQLKVQNSSCELEHEMDLTKWMSCTLISCYEYHHMNMNISSSFNYYILRLQLFDQNGHQRSHMSNGYKLTILSHHIPLSLQIYFIEDFHNFHFSDTFRHFQTQFLVKSHFFNNGFHNESISECIVVVKCCKLLKLENGVKKGPINAK